MVTLLLSRYIYRPLQQRASIMSSCRTRRNIHDIKLIPTCHVMYILTVNGKNQLSCRLSVVGGGTRVDGVVVDDGDMRNQ